MKQSRTAPSGATPSSPASRAPLGPDADPPAAAEDPAAAAPVEPPGSPPTLIFSDPDGPETWLVAARASLLDLHAAAREGARRPRHRVLARAEIRRQAREAFAGASALLDEAAEALQSAMPLMIKRAPPGDAPTRRTSSR